MISPVIAPVIPVVAPPEKILRERWGARRITARSYRSSIPRRTCTPLTPPFRSKLYPPASCCEHSCACASEAANQMRTKGYGLEHSHSVISRGRVSGGAASPGLEPRTRIQPGYRDKSEVRLLFRYEPDGLLRSGRPALCSAQLWATASQRTSSIGLRASVLRR